MKWTLIVAIFLYCNLFEQILIMETLKPPGGPNSDPIDKVKFNQGQLLIWGALENR